MQRVKPNSSFYRILIYGNPKTGKTRLATAYPEAWGNGAYIAIDPGSESLDAVMPRYRKRFEDNVVAFRPLDPKAKFDPLHAAVEAANYDWAADGVGVLVWDTISVMAHELLMAYARKGNFAKEQITFGTPGTPEHHCHPTPGDYGSAQSSVLHILGFLFRQKAHVIVLAHPTWAEPKANEGGTIIGGPATAGSAQVRDLGGMFPALIRTDTKTVREPGKVAETRFMAYNSPKGIWQAGTRVGGDPIPDIELAVDPSHFWVTWEAAVKGE